MLKVWLKLIWDSLISEATINRHGINYDHVLIGNPHAVINLADNNISEENYQDIALDIQSSWKDGINVGFMSIIDNNSIQLKVFERGSGFTLACGSGACAAAAVAISKNKSEISYECKHGWGCCSDRLGYEK